MRRYERVAKSFLNRRGELAHELERDEEGSYRFPSLSATFAAI